MAWTEAYSTCTIGDHCRFQSWYFFKAGNRALLFMRQHMSCIVPGPKNVDPRSAHMSPHTGQPPPSHNCARTWCLAVSELSALRSASNAAAAVLLAPSTTLLLAARLVPLLGTATTLRTVARASVV